MDHPYLDTSPEDATSEEIDRETFSRILDHASKKAGVPTLILMSRCKCRHCAFGRRLLYLGLRSIGWSYPKIGRVVGRDHQTIWHSCNVASRYSPEPVEVAP